jgi:predicted SnoaL-like aldol condensation-catalyzing enzyme
MEGTMSIEKNKEIVKRLFEEVFNNRNIVVLDELIAPNYTNHNVSIQVSGLNGLKRAFEAQLKAFPDLNTSLEDIIAEGNRLLYDVQIILLTNLTVNRYPFPGSRFSGWKMENL